MHAHEQGKVSKEDMDHLLLKVEKGISNVSYMGISRVIRSANRYLAAAVISPLINRTIKVNESRHVCLCERVFVYVCVCVCVYVCTCV